MAEPNREVLIREALMHVRNALLAAKYGAPVTPALLCAEEALLPMLFSPTEVAEYLARGNPPIGRDPR